MIKVGPEVGRTEIQPPHEASSAGGDPVAALLHAQIAAEKAITAEVMTQIAAEAATRAMTRARQTAEAAVSVASEAAAEAVAEASAVEAERAVAASAATRAAERMRLTFAGVISAEVDANVALAQVAKTLSEELAARKETEARLLDREAELTAFAAMVAHDLNAPLRAVSGFTAMLRSDLADTVPGGLDATTLDRMDRILAATDRMRQLVDDQLAFVTARDRTLNLQPIDLEAMITEIVSEIRTISPGTTESIADIDIGRLPTVEADPVMCRQLLDNLISNALMYTPPGQPAHVQISASTEPGSLAHANMVHVEIADQGIGIPPGQHEKLFVSFYRAQADYPGTGIGLAICQRIIERHGGTIAASDNPGGGSVFHFTLPSETAATGGARF